VCRVYREQPEHDQLHLPTNSLSFSPFPLSPGEYSRVGSAREEIIGMWSHHTDTVQIEWEKEVSTEHTQHSDKSVTQRECGKPSLSFAAETCKFPWLANVMWLMYDLCVWGWHCFTNEEMEYNVAARQSRAEQKENMNVKEITLNYIRVQIFSVCSGDIKTQMHCYRGLW